jgi:hypothetical protein
MKKRAVLSLHHNEVHFIRHHSIYYTSSFLNWSFLCPGQPQNKKDSVKCIAVCRNRCRSSRAFIPNFPSEPPPKKKAGDYIEFEEIK